MTRRVFKKKKNYFWGNKVTIYEICFSGSPRHVSGTSGRSYPQAYKLDQDACKRVRST